MRRISPILGKTKEKLCMEVVGYGGNGLYLLVFL